MIENYIFDKICDYIDNEIDYIKGEIASNNYGKGELEDLRKLEKMTTNTKMNIANQIISDEALEEAINEIIHDYIYE